MLYRVFTVYGRPFEPDGKGVYLAIDLDGMFEEGAVYYIKGWVRNFFWHAEIKRDVENNGYNRSFEIEHNGSKFKIIRLAQTLFAVTKAQEAKEEKQQKLFKEEPKMTLADWKALGDQLGFTQKARVKQAKKA